MASRTDIGWGYAPAQAVHGRIAVRRAEAAAALGISVDSFERYVQPEIRAIRIGTLRVFRIADIEDWAEANASRVLEPDYR